MESRQIVSAERRASGRDVAPRARDGDGAAGARLSDVQAVGTEGMKEPTRSPDVAREYEGRVRVFGLWGWLT